MIKDCEKEPLTLWREYKDNGGFYDYKQWLEENGYMEVEEWVPAYEFEFEYEVSNLGRVRNAWNGKILKQTTNRKGYKCVTLYIGGQKFSKRVHRLVAESFNAVIPEGMDVNHIDGDKSNNELSNLEFCTRKENVRHAIDNGLAKPNDFGKKRVKVRCIETGVLYKSINECSRDTRVDVAEIRRYLSGKVKTNCKGYTFEKVD